MKKLLALVMAGAMALGLVACGQPAEGGSAGDDEFKVGAIYINSQNDTSGYTFQHHQGITTAMEQLGLDPESQLAIVDNVKEEDGAVFNAIDILAGQGCDIIFGISFGYINAMDAAAKEYPDIIFSHATGYMSNETNFNNYFGRIYQARYLSGVAAGLKSLETGNNAIGYVAAYNTEYAETCSGINAFTLGVQSANPNAKVYVNQISTWGDEAKEKSAAQALIDTYNCGVIAQHCDSAQPQMCAADNGVFGVGYNSDMTDKAPTAHLTAAIWHWDVYYKEAIAAAQEDPQGFMNSVGNYYGGLAENFVGISPLTNNCAANTQAVVDAVSDLIVSGEWDVFSGVKLSYNIGENGSVEIVRTDADLKDNQGNVIVPAGGQSITDEVIKGSMDYNVEGVVVG